VTIRVVVADDHAVVRGGLEQLLSTASDIELVASASGGGEAVELVARERPDVVLMDLSMPEIDGAEATRRILVSDPAARVVVLTSFADDRHIAEALRAGAIGYVLKHAEPDELLGAIRAAAAGDAPLDPKAARVLLDSRRLRSDQQLSGREEEVLRLVAAGLANKQIARRLGIAERTVKAHLTNIFARIEVSDRTQAALWAERNLHPEEP
jgi:DNA-binding NarL/FixJ family response regulator